MAEHTQKDGLHLEQPIAASDTVTVGRSIEEITVDVIHELGSRGTALTVTTHRVVPPSRVPTIVTIRSQVLGQPGSSASPEYLGTVRRRKARRLADSILELAKYSDRTDFVVWTYPVLEQIKELIATLSDATAEGNTREILRQVRDSFMNGGWESYRRPDARNVAFMIADQLASATEVAPKDVDAAFESLMQARLNPVGRFICDPVFQDEELDGEEAEVSS